MYDCNLNFDFLKVCKAVCMAVHATTSRVHLYQVYTKPFELSLATQPIIVFIFLSFLLKENFKYIVILSSAQYEPCYYDFQGGLHYKLHLHYLLPSSLNSGKLFDSFFHRINNTMDCYGLELVYNVCCSLFIYFYFNEQELKQDISSFRYEVLGMMKSKPHSGGTSPVASTTLAYPGNSFKYCRKPAANETQKKSHTFEAKSPTILQNKAANTTNSPGSNYQNNCSVVVWSAEKTEIEISKEQSKGECSPKQEQTSFLKCDEINSLFVASGRQNQDNALSGKADVEVSQNMIAETQEIGLSCTVLSKEVTNGPKKMQT